MLESASSGFSDLIVTGERIENCLKSGKIQSVTVVQNGVKKHYVGFAKKKEGGGGKCCLDI